MDMGGHTVDMDEGNRQHGWRSQWIWMKVIQFYEGSHRAYRLRS